MLDHAMQYVEQLGWHIFPVWWVNDDGSCGCGDPHTDNQRNIGKHPITPHGVMDASNDMKSVFHWWKRWPQANIGLHCGPSGILALDLDVYKDEYLPNAIDELLTKEDENTVTSLTGSGGVHLLYKCDKKYGNHRKYLPPGLDVRCWGAYIVLPPSNHRLGAYQWEIDYAPLDRPILPVPTKLAAILDRILLERQESAQRAKDAALLVTPEFDMVADALRFIPAQQDYNDWVSVLMAVHSAYPDGQGIAVCEAWSPGYDGEIAAKFKSFRGNGVGLGTLGYMARANGWKGSFEEEYDGFGPDAPAFELPPPLPPTIEHNSWPYSIKDGRLTYSQQTKKDGLVDHTIADFAAKITGEILDEDGVKFFTIEGQGIRGGKFTTEISADEFGSAPKLTALMESISAFDGIATGMGTRVGPAIKALTESMTFTQRFTRTGWHGDHFLIPGREPEGTEIKLDQKAAAYDLTRPGDIAKAVKALEALIDGVGTYGTVLAGYTLFPPLAALCGWRNMRYGLFMRGITGSLKTTTGRLAMAIWGQRFATEELYEKAGQYGSTINGLIGRAAEIADLPFMIDNFKPNTQGKEAVTSLIHGIMEGFTKSRSMRNGDNAPAKPLLCWPLMTGEDVPGHDTAAMARLLILDLPSRQGIIPDGIQIAQQYSAHLSAIGAAWLELLETDGQRVSNLAKAEFDKLRDEFAAQIRLYSPESENILRSATNLALNRVAWRMLGQLPCLAPLIARYDAEHYQALIKLCRGLSEHTAQHLEGVQFIDILNELIGAGRVHLAQRNISSPYGVPVIGWIDDDGSINLYPSITREQIDRVDPNALNSMSMNAIYKQLEQMGKLVAKGSTSTAVRYDVRTSKPTRVLILAADALNIATPTEQEIIAEELGL